MKLVVALDLPTPKTNLDLVKDIIESENTPDISFKVGLNTYIAGGPAFVKDLVNITSGYNDICLDLKLYDIPNTMAESAKIIRDLGVNLFTIHASSGEQGMCAVMNSLENIKEAPSVLAVTILTSFTNDHCCKIYKEGRTKTTNRLISEAISAGVDGVVCSSHHLKMVRDIQNLSNPCPNVIKFVPGIELKPRKDDQVMKGTLKDVIQGDADYIVVGRQIYKDKNPCVVVSKILKKIKTMKKMWNDFNQTSIW